MSSWALDRSSAGTPQLSLTGTQATTQGELASRSSTSSHSLVRSSTVVVENSYAAGISAHTSRPSRSHQARKRGSSTFWCSRTPLKPRSLTSCTSRRSASSDGAARCDSGQKFWASTSRRKYGRPLSSRRSRDALMLRSAA
jgi:hypothetical protein